jgi:hypothetical protein
MILTIGLLSKLHAIMKIHVFDFHTNFLAHNYFGAVGMKKIWQIFLNQFYILFLRTMIFVS